MLYNDKIKDLDYTEFQKWVDEDPQNRSTTITITISKYGADVRVFVFDAKLLKGQHVHSVAEINFMDILKDEIQLLKEQVIELEAKLS